MNSPDVYPPDSARTASDPPADSLFPLRFTPFEFYYWLEDRPDYPSVFPIRIECQGSLDREAFERAYRMAHARHPLLSARIECDAKGWPSWVAGEPAPIHFHDDPDAPAEMCLDAASLSGVNVQVNCDGDRRVISIRFHHVAVDGIGAFQFISDFMVAYATECAPGGGLPPWRPLDRDLLADRDGHQLFKRKLKAVDLVRVARGTISLLVQRAAVVSNRERPAGTAPSDPAALGFLVHTLSELETRELVCLARKLEVRLNDLLVRDYFLTLADWNRGTAQSRHCLRILVPQNLRRKIDYRMPAANVFSFSFLTRRIGDCDRPQELLATVHEEMTRIKRARWGLYFEAGLRLICIWPWLLRRSLKRDWPFATAIFTNLGGAFDHVPLPWRDGRRVSGNLLVENGYGAAPIRPETRLALAVHTYAGRMSISVRCDPRTFNRHERQQILEAYLDRLRTTLKSGA